MGSHLKENLTGKRRLFYAWPPLAQDPDLNGEPIEGGSIGIRAFGIQSDPMDTISQSNNFSALMDSVDAEGFQNRMYGIFGSGRTLFTLLPKDKPNDPPQSFFWIVPGERISVPASKHNADLVALDLLHLTGH